EYEKSGHYDQAMQVYQEALKKDVRNARLLSRIGDLYLKKGEKDQAIAAYEKSAQYNPSDSESQVNLATAYMEKGRMADAEKIFRWVLSVEDYPLAHKGLGLVEIQKQDAATAKAEFERALE